MQNYYEILGISRDATQEEIKNAYRKLAKKYHPDSSGSSEDKERFQEIQEAYSVLSDPEKRKIYNYYGHETYRKNYYAQHAAGNSAYGHASHRHEGCGGDYDGSCGGNHGGGRGGSCGGSHSGDCDGSCGGNHGGGCDGSCGGNHGGDCDGNCGSCEHHHGNKETDEEQFRHVVRTAVWLEMEETFTEVTKHITLKERMPDPEDSSGRRYIEKEWQLKIKLPANTFENQMFDLADVLCENQELLGRLYAAYPDNLYVVIILLRQRPGYTRQAYHLYLDYDIDFHTLVLGGRIKIPGLTGSFLFDLPPGTSPEKPLRIPNQGLNYPPNIGKRGDLYLNLHVKIPTSLTEAQLLAFQMLRSAFADASSERNL